MAARSYGFNVIWCGVVSGLWCELAGYTFQTYAFLSRMMSQLQPPLAVAAGARHSRKAESSNSSSVVFFERSVFSDRYIFAENCAATGLFNSVEWNIYKDWHTWLLDTFENLQLDGIIYLRTKPETCMQRCRKRSRSEEGGIPLEYLTQASRHVKLLLLHGLAAMLPAALLPSGLAPACMRHVVCHVACCFAAILPCVPPRLLNPSHPLCKARALGSVDRVPCLHGTMAWEAAAT